VRVTPVPLVPTEEAAASFAALGELGAELGVTAAIIPSGVVGTLLIQVPAHPPRSLDAGRAAAGS
jgi:hypothetical protein